MADVSIDASISTSTARGMRSVVFTNVPTNTAVAGDSLTTTSASGLFINGGTAGSAETNQAQAQSFTATASYNCLRIQLRLRKQSSPTDNLVLTVYTGSQTGTVVATSDNFAGSSLTTSFAWVTFTFGTQFAIASGTKYWLVLTRDGARDSTNTYVVEANSSSLLANGGSSSRNNNAWGLESVTVDLLFQMMSYTIVNTGYFFYIDSAGIFVYSKSTNGGASWGSAVTISIVSTQIAYDVWFDQWTPGDSGTLIHTWYFDSTNDIVRWRSLDTSSDTLGTERSCFTGASAVAGRGAFVSGTKTRSGYLYCVADIDAGAERSFNRSTDGGATWGAQLSGTPSTFIEATLDTCKLYPASGTGDNNDCWAIYYDASATAMTLKLWDSSGATAIESATIGVAHTDGATDLTGQFGYDASVRHSDGHLILATLSGRDVAASTHQVFDITDTSTITTKTAIAASTDDHYYPQVFIDQNTDDIYVSYNGKRDGSEVLDTTTKIYYTKSTDDATSWSAGDTAYQEGATAADLQVWSPISGPRFYVGWRVGTTLVGNAVNSVDVSGGGGPTEYPKALTATFSPTAALRRSILEGGFTAALSFVGTLTKGLLYLRSLTATLSFIAEGSGRLGKGFTGTLAPVATLSRRIAKSIAASFSLIAGLTKNIRMLKLTRGIGDPGLSFVGNLARSQFAVRALTATLSFSGAIRRGTGKPFSAELDFVTALVKNIRDRINATLSFVGNLATTFISGGGLLFQSLTATFSPTAALSRKVIDGGFTATLSFLGATTKSLRDSFTATRSHTGAITKRIIDGGFSATLSFVGNLVTSFISGGVLYLRSFTATLFQSAGAFFSDTFNRANGSLGSNWTSPIGTVTSGGGAEGTLQIVSNQVGATVDDQHAYALWNGAFSDDQYAQITVPQIGAWTGVILRAEYGVDRFYQAFSFGANDYRIYRRWNGVYESLAPGTAITWSTGDILRLESSGSVHPFSLRLYRNGALVEQWTSPDSTYEKSGGAPGIGIYSQAGLNLRLDDFEGGNYSPLHVSDSFNRADGALGSNWTATVASQTSIVVSSNTAGVSAHDLHGAYFWSANNFADNHYAQFRWFFTGAAYTGAILRADATTDQYYLGLVNHANLVTLYARWSGSYVSLATATPSLANGDMIRLEVTGSVHPITITMYQNGNVILSWTSPSSTNVRAGGSPGMGIYSPTGNTLVLDDWEGGNLVATGAAVAALTRKTSHPLGATLSFIAALGKRIPKAFTATLTFIGAITKRISDAGFAATLSFSGFLAQSKSFLKAFAATLNFSGFLASSKSLLKALTATLSFSGTLRPRINKAFAATLSFAMTLAKKLAKRITATLSFIGNLVATFIPPGPQVFTKAFTATYAPTAALIRRITRTFAAVLAFIGNLAQIRLFLKNFNATLFLSSIDPSTITGLTVWLDGSTLALADGADVSPWPDLSGNGNNGNIVATPAPKLRASALNGKAVVRFNYNEGRVRGARGLHPTLPAPAYNYSIFYVGRMVGPNVGRVFSGLYPSTNFLVGYHTSSQDVAYDASFIGAVVGYPSGTPTPWRQWGMTGQHDGTNYLASFYKDTALVGSVIAGSGLQSNYNLSGYAGPSAEETCDCEVAELLIYDHKLADTERIALESYLNTKWGLGLAGGGGAAIATLNLRIGKAIAATRMTTGILVRRVTHSFAAALSFLAVFRRTFPKAFAAALSFIGNLSRTRAIVRAFAATLAFSGAIRRRTGKAFAATIGFSSILGKAIRKVFGATLSFIGFLFRGGAITVIAGMVTRCLALIGISGSTARIGRAGSELEVLQVKSEATIPRTGSTLRVERTK